MVLAQDPLLWSSRDRRDNDQDAVLFFWLVRLAKFIKINIYEICITGRRRLFTES